MNEWMNGWVTGKDRRQSKPCTLSAAPLSCRETQALKNQKLSSSSSCAQACWDKNILAGGVPYGDCLTHKRVFYCKRICFDSGTGRPSHQQPHVTVREDTLYLHLKTEEPTWPWWSVGLSHQLYLIWHKQAWDKSCFTTSSCSFKKRRHKICNHLQQTTEYKHGQFIKGAS